MKIIHVALISEGILLIIAITLAFLADLSIKWNFTWQTITLGCLATLPPLIINSLLWSYTTRNTDTVYARFSREIIVPLCRKITLPEALTVAVLAGVCEEILFRGALNQLIMNWSGPAVACIITSTTFATMHFIGHFKRYGGMIPLYTAMGVYLWFAHYLTDSLAAVAILHGVYNFIVMLSVRKKSQT